MNDLLTIVEGTKSAFRRTFGYTPPHVVQAPGRIELLGNHTDHCEGLVMAATINQYVILTGAPRTDGRISVFSAAFDQKETFSRAELSPLPSPHWINYVKGLLSELRRRGISFPGFDLAIGGNLPAGAGLASSAALLVGLAMFMHHLAPFLLGSALSAARPRQSRRNEPATLTAHEKREMARLAHRAEVEYVGLKCGMLDQLACLLGQEAHALEIDCQSLSLTNYPLYGQVAWIFCDTGIRHQLIDGAYNEIRLQCNQAATALGVASLRKVDLKGLESRRSVLTPRQYDCASHVLRENQRVLFGARALQEGDFEQFGQYLFQSHDSSRDLLRNSCDELDLLVDLARRHPACLGARLTGGGFGGATVHLVRADQTEAYAAALKRGFQERLSYEPVTQVARVINGAGVMTSNY